MFWFKKVFIYFYIKEQLLFNLPIAVSTLKGVSSEEIKFYWIFILFSNYIYFNLINVVSLFKKTLFIQVELFFCLVLFVLSFLLFLYLVMVFYVFLCIYYGYGGRVVVYLLFSAGFFDILITYF